jgi:hypothetical protein
MTDMPGVIDAQIELVSGTILPYPATRSELRNLMQQIGFQNERMLVQQIHHEGKIHYVFVQHIIRIISPVNFL